MTPAVSVVMPVRNGGGLFEAAAESVLDQSHRDLELVVIDDGSTDQTPAQLEALARRDERVVALRLESAGIVEALNAGCAAARGHYLARMDADDICLPQRLSDQLELLERRPQLGIVGGQMICTDLAGSDRWEAEYPTDDAGIRAMLGSANPFGHPAVTMRRDVLEACGGYRAACPHAEDYDLWVRILDHCQGANLATPVVVYRAHTGQTAFREWKQHCLSTMAVRAAVRIRRAGGGDPLEGVELVSEQTLASMGVTRAAMGTEFAETLISLSGMAGRLGAAPERRRLLAEARVVSESYALTPETVTRLGRAQAAVCLEDGRPVGAAAALARTIRAEPRLSANLAHGWVSRAVAGLVARAGGSRRRVVGGRR